jgi:hypothetical protein
MANTDVAIAGLSFGLAVCSVLLGCAGIILKANASSCDEVDILWGCIRYSKNKGEDTQPEVAV